jgi:hypothetical protein
MCLDGEGSAAGALVSSRGQAVGVGAGWAGHLFEKPGLLEAVADAACEWCGRHLKQQQQGDKQAGVTPA